MLRWPLGQRLQLALPRPGRLRHLARRDRSPGKMGGQPGTGLSGSGRARHSRAVAFTTPSQETAQTLQPRRASARLASTARVRSKAELCGTWNGAGLDAVKRRQSRRRHDSFAHEAIPGLGPAVSRAQATNNAVLSNLVPRNAMVAAPSRHATVAVIGPGIAGFLVGVERRYLKVGTKRLQHLGYRANPHDERLTKRRKIAAQCEQAVCDKSPMTRSAVRQAPECRLHDKQGQYRPLRRSHHQGTVVRGPEVPLKPNDAKRSLHQGLSKPSAQRATALS